MTFTEVKRRTVHALQDGTWSIEQRPDQEKNWLGTGDLDKEEAIAIVQAARGPGRRSPHHLVPTIEVWELLPIYRKIRWYVKVYFTENCVFISFHPSEGRS